MPEDNSIAKWFDASLARLLAEKIKTVHSSFNGKAYIRRIQSRCKDLGYSQRVELHADTLREHLPDSYPEAIDILVQVLGDENPNETGMFREYYWVLPIGKFIENYGLDHHAVSMKAIEEVTKRNTGEYAIRPFIRKSPRRTVKVMAKWAKSRNFHLRRLASEGLRPRLPWSTKLDLFIEDPSPVFQILELLMEDEIKFVQRSVANNLTDYLKVNKPAAVGFIRRFNRSKNPNTQWIIKHATRKIKL